jgi:hypothetical protein
MKTWAVGAIIGGLGIAVSVLGVLVVLLLTQADDSASESSVVDSPTATPTPEATALATARLECATMEVGLAGGTKGARYMLLEDDDRTLIISGGDQFSTPAVGFCVLDALDAPASTMSKVEGTTSMMGQLTDQFDDLELTWSYHPDNGLNMVIETIS